MNQEPPHLLFWSEEKRLRLRACLTGMWAEDTWLLPSINEQGNPVQRTLCVVFANVLLHNEFTYAVWYQWHQGIWQHYHKRGQRAVLYSLRYLVSWLQDIESSLRTLAKRYLAYNLSVHSASDTQRKLTALQHFSSFLAQAAPQVGVADLDRALLLH